MGYILCLPSSVSSLPERSLRATSGADVSHFTYASSQKSTIASSEENHANRTAYTGRAILHILLRSSCIRTALMCDWRKEIISKGIRRDTRQFLGVSFPNFTGFKFRHRPPSLSRASPSEYRSRSRRATPYTGARAFRDSECKCGRIRALYFSHVAIQSNVGMRGEGADTKTPGHTRSHPLLRFPDSFPARRTNRETIVAAGNFLAEESKGEFGAGWKERSERKRTGL